MQLLSALVNEVLWLNPVEITHKIGSATELRGTIGGDWDIDRATPFKETAKYRAIAAHLNYAIPWLETDLFRDTYTRRLAQDGHIGTARTLEEFASQFEQRFAGVLASMRRDGFRLLSCTRKRYPQPSLLIGRDGQVFIGNQGNHRLAIAQVLGLDRFAGRIVCRHQLSSA